MRGKFCQDTVKLKMDRKPWGLSNADINAKVVKKNNNLYIYIYTHRVLKKNMTLSSEAEYPAFVISEVEMYVKKEKITQVHYSLLFHECKVSSRFYYREIFMVQFTFQNSFHFILINILGM